MSNNLHWPSLALPPKLAADEVHVWAAPLDVSQRTYDAFLATLAPDERIRASAYRFDEPRRRYVVARGALRDLLGKYLAAPAAAIELAVESNQKPRLASQYTSSGLHFNVSHSGKLALIAFAVGCEVGIDIEALHEVSQLEQIAQRFFHPSETSAVLAANEADRSRVFLRCWTGKESVLKALGTGIIANLAEFQVPSGDDWRGWVEWSAVRSSGTRSRCWVEQLTPNDEYIAAVSCVESKRTVRSYAI
jgi:4'-phosphopantetheinyl transferase